jgi:hypothetical protein
MLTMHCCLGCPGRWRQGPQGMRRGARLEGRPCSLVYPPAKRHGSRPQLVSAAHRDRQACVGKWLHTDWHTDWHRVPGCRQSRKCCSARRQTPLPDSHACICKHEYIPCAAARLLPRLGTAARRRRPRQLGRASSAAAGSDNPSAGLQLGSPRPTSTVTPVYPRLAFVLWRRLHLLSLGPWSARLPSSLCKPGEVRPSRPGLPRAPSGCMAALCGVLFAEGAVEAGCAVCESARLGRPHRGQHVPTEPSPHGGSRQGLSSPLPGSQSCPMRSLAGSGPWPCVPLPGACAAAQGFARRGGGWRMCVNLHMPQIRELLSSLCIRAPQPQCISVHPAPKPAASTPWPLPPRRVQPSRRRSQCSPHSGQPARHTALRTIAPPTSSAPPSLLPPHASPSRQLQPPAEHRGGAQHGLRRLVRTAAAPRLRQASLRAARGAPPQLGPQPCAPP